MIIGQINPVRFRKVDDNLPSFDNTLLADEKFYNDKIFTYCQRFPDTLTQTIQIKSNDDTVPTATAIKADKTTVNLPVTLESSYDTDGDSTDDLFFFEFNIPFTSFTDVTYVTVTQLTESYRSEPFKGDSNLLTEVANGEVLKIEYFNFDNAFQIDFSTGITFELYVEGIIKDYEYGGESSIYDNQDELTKLKETAKRLFTFKTLEIPRYLGETIRLASSTDNLVINDIAYVREDLPESTPVEGSNLIDFSMTINDKEYLGVNSHDIGFNCDVAPTEGEIMILTIENASGSETFTIPEGFLVHTLRSQWVSGTSVEIKLGTSLGGDELVYPRNLDSVDTDRTTAIHGDINRDADQDIYATVTGGVANLDLQLIQNKES